LSGPSSAPGSRLLELWGEVADLQHALELAGWDEETQMPPRGQHGRGKLMGTLAGMLHARLVARELSDAIAEAEESAGADGVLAAQAREAKREVRRASRIPASLAREKAEAQSAGLAAWKAARERSDFGLFRDPLARLVDLVREEADALREDGQRAYDVLVDEYEPGTSEAELAPLFDGLRAELAPLVGAVVDSGKVVDEEPILGDYAPEAQLAFGCEVARRMGFDFDAGRIDRAAHPFCTGFGPGDVRITWRFLERDFRSALYGIMHEAGHGLYEQGLPTAWQRTPIGAAVSLGVHESQSRLWENLVGRGASFWRWALPRFHEHFPAKRGLTADELLPALRTVKPTPIRVEADEGTYDLHVMVRFDLERRLFAGELGVDDLPAAWDAGYGELLGIRPANAAEGVLQDLHWASGSFGYFPTYTLGNLMMAQLYRAAGEALGDLEEALAAGDFAPLRGWLRENVHRHGSRFAAGELIERATGRPLSADDYLAQRRRAVEAVYGIAV